MPRGKSLGESERPRRGGAGRTPGLPSLALPRPRPSPDRGLRGRDVGPSELDIVIDHGSQCIQNELDRPEVDFSVSQANDWRKLATLHRSLAGSRA